MLTKMGYIDGIHVTIAAPWIRHGNGINPIIHSVQFHWMILLRHVLPGRTNGETLGFAQETVG